MDGLLRGFKAEAAEVLRGVAAVAVELNATAGEMAGTAQDGVSRATSVAAASSGELAQQSELLRGRVDTFLAGIRAA
ncbi:hypothetical protein D9599_16765 [Roseomonas sp. KE2513]|nr:hypothetical protein [Roseomonas sp. KE2513]